MQIFIRQENKKDFLEVFNLIKDAFEKEELSDYKEQFLVDRLRRSKAFIPELSLVAELNNEIVGHILLTKIKIVNKEQSFDSLALAPVSVKPKYQLNGIGSKLIMEAHKRAKEMGFSSVIVLGHHDYYPKFGYELTSKYNIVLPFDAPDNACMVVTLVKEALNGISGKVIYAKEFYE